MYSILIIIENLVGELRNARLRKRPYPIIIIIGTHRKGYNEKLEGNLLLYKLSCSATGQKKACSRMSSIADV
jgi:hypothetical protein